MSSVLSQKIFQSVLTNTDSDVPPSDSLAQLVKFCEDPATKDLVYNSILNHAKNSQSNTLVLARCVKLWKQNLTTHVPNNKVLSEIDDFCVQLMTASKSAQISQSAAYVRALVSKHHTTEKVEKSEPASEISASHTGSPMKQGVTKTNNRKEHVVNSFLKERPASANFPKRAPGTLPPTVLPLLHCDLFGGHLKKEASQAGRFEIVTGVTQCALDATTSKRILTVSEVKKGEETKVYKEEGQIPVRRKGPQLFVYKHYARQEALDVADAKFRQLLDILVNPTPENQESFAVASKVLIKIMMDQYCSGDQRNIELIFSVFLELLEGSVAIQRHAFDLLFNLAVHANLYSDMTSSGESKADDEDSDKIRLTAEKIHEDLFQKLREMIYVVFHKRKTESGLWKTALNCLFFFLSSNGHIDKARLLEVDIRWIPVFLSRTKGLSDFACRQLVKMLVNLLYVDDVLSNERVQVVGGIDYIIQLFVSTRSEEARGNLFVVLFDYVISQQPVLQRATADVQLIFDLFKYLGAHNCFHELFIYVPPEFVETFTRFIYFDRFKKDPFLAPVEKSLNKSHVVSILYEFESLAKKYNQCHPEFAQMLAVCIKAEAIPPKELEVLRMLLTSDIDAERENGELWLFALIEHFKLGEVNRKYDSEVSKTVDTLMQELLHSRKPKERKSHLAVVNRMVHWRKNRLSKQWSDADLAQLFGMLNERLTRFVATQESDEDILLFIADMILGIVSVSTAPTRTQDLDYDAYLAGEISVPDYLLKGINISVIHHAFMNLQPQRKNIKAALLLLMIEQCKVKIRLESIGGMNFFKGLLASREPQIAYHASRFIVEHLKMESPEKYKAMFEDLLSKAQETNDEKLLDNPYLQVREILKMFENYK